MLTGMRKGSLLPPHGSADIRIPSSQIPDKGTQPLGQALQLTLCGRKAEVRGWITLTFTHLPVPSGILCLHNRGLSAIRGPQMKSC